MRKILLAAVLIAAGCALSFAQAAQGTAPGATQGTAPGAATASVTIQNEEDSPFYYTVDPQDLAQVTPGSPLAATKVAEFFAAQADQPQFTALAPGGQASLQGLSNGAHLLVGFFAVRDQDTFPVRLITLQADSSMGERFYAIYGSPALVDATRGVGRLAQFARSSSTEQAAAQTQQAPSEQAPPGAAAQATTPATPPPAQQPAAQQPAAAQAAAASAAPQAAAPIASFSPSYNPVYFTRESRGNFSVQPIADSRSWTLPGTHISSLSAHIDEGILTLSLASAEGFASDVSYFIYAFTSRTPGSTAAFTLELRPRALLDRGACILWLNAEGTATPVIFGSVKVEGTTATLVADLKDEPASLSQTLSSAGSFDLTSCRFDAASGVYEEFYFATVAMADIPVTR